jgi:hypothetical protein
MADADDFKEKLAALSEAERARVGKALLKFVDDAEHDPGYVDYLEREIERLDAELVAFKSRCCVNCENAGGLSSWGALHCLRGFGYNKPDWSCADWQEMKP